MPLLVDVNNVLHVVGVLPPDLAGIEVEDLGGLVESSRFRQEEIVFVCDGKPRRHRTSGRIKLLFSGAGISADDVIVRLVRRSTAPRRLTVVSSDREIATAVRRRRARVISSESFLSVLAEDASRSPVPRGSRATASERHPADQRQVEHWLRLFGVEADPITMVEGSSPRVADGAEPSTSPVSPKPSPVDASDDRKATIHDAERLSDIDPRDLDELDMDDLLDEDS